MENVTPMSPALSSRPTYSCVRCSERKVKCDRQHPCSACIKHNVQCVFRSQRPPRRRRRHEQTEVLNERLKHYEALLQQQGILPDAPLNPQSFRQHREPGRSGSMAPDTNPQVPTPVSVVSEPRQSVTKTQLLQDQGGAKFVDNSLWTRVVEEFHGSEGVLGEEFTDEESDAVSGADTMSFILDNSSSRTPSCSHPVADKVLELWHIFTENVDPLTKVIHVPTLRVVIQKATEDLRNVPRTLEALMFAIYAIAVLSLRDDECRDSFGESRKSLLARYIPATRAALAQAKFMGTSNLMVLQALILHIFVVRVLDEPRAVWVLTGVAVRMAEAMGLHRDGASLGLPPFEAEIRRRVWWQLKMHDYRSAELGGLTKFRGMEADLRDCNPPSNVNDDDLYPGMTSLPAVTSRPTDMIFSILRFEMSSQAVAHAINARRDGRDEFFWDRVVNQSDLSDKEQFLTSMEETFEIKYLRYCDPSQPLQLMAMLFARCALNVGRFLSRHPRRWASAEETPEAERIDVWNIAINLLGQYEMTQSSPILQRFAWYTGYYIQWHAFIHVLDSLRTNPFIPDAAKAWRLVEATYRHNPDMITNTKRLVYVAIGHLCLKAFAAREAAHQTGSNVALAIPEYIAKLRQQREAAKARRQAQGVKEQTSKGESNPSESSTRDSLGNNHDFHKPSSSSHFAEMDQPETFVSDDTFWLVNGFDTGSLGIRNDVSHMDPDFMLAQDHFLGQSSDQTISWAQWESWLSDSIMPQTNFGLDVRSRVS